MNARGKKLAFKIFLGYVPSVLLIYALGVYTLIRSQANRDEAQPADLIVVFGAAQYNGRPSPVFKARLDHGVELFNRKLSPRIITTGGHGLDPRFSEAEVGKAYLIKQDVPASCIETEAGGLTTLGSIQRILEVFQLRRKGRVIVVSDGFHLFRIKQIFGDHQVKAFGSPARNSPIESNLRSRVWASLREVVGYTAYLAREKLHLPIPAGEPLNPRDLRDRRQNRDSSGRGGRSSQNAGSS